MNDWTRGYNLQLEGAVPIVEPWIQGPWIAKTVVNKQLMCHEWVIGPARQNDELEWKITQVAAKVSTCCGPEMTHTAALVANAPYMFRMLMAVAKGYDVDMQIKTYVNGMLNP
jgi:hypothetical protein